MARRPIAFNNSSKSNNSIKKNSIEIGVASDNYANNPGGLTWFNGPDSTNQYVIYSDTYSLGMSTLANSKPVCWGSGDMTDANVLKMINGLPTRNNQVPFTTIASALTWVAASSVFNVVSGTIDNIVTNGLVFSVDASQKGSYPGSGTIWYDLSGNNNNGLLENGTSFNSASGGVITFDGINDRINAPSSSVYDFTHNNAFSLETFCYATQQSSSGMIPLIERYFWSTSGFGGYGMRLRNYSTNFPDFFVTGTPVGSPVTDNFVRGTTQWVPNTWYHIIGTKSTNGIMKIYVNGVLEGTTTGVTNIPLPQTGMTLKIGARGDTNDQYSNQRFGVCRIYNKELSASEVLQNFNAQKSRFGL
jgi:hypothetical protein